MVYEPALTTDFATIVVVATVVGLLARQLGQPTIIAYILTGLALGPAALGLVTPTVLTETMAELGLAFLLFLLGIKMRLDDVRDILGPILAVSLPQMVAIAGVGTGIAWLLGFGPVEAILIGLAVTYSSTAVVIKVLTDRDEATALHGRLNVGVLLVQDIVVVVVLAVLAAGQPDDVTAILTTLGVVLALVSLIGVGALIAARWVLPWVFREVADHEDVFFLTAISWAFLFIFATDFFDLSIEMGAFLAGVAIAQLPYSVELQDRINPLTDLFMLVFFASIGLQLQADELLRYWPEAILATAILVPAKFLVFYGLYRWQGFDRETRVIGASTMIQVSEFGLVVGTVATAEGFVAVEILGFLSLVTLLSMIVSVLVIQYNWRALEVFDRWRGDGEPIDVGSATAQPRSGHAVVIGLDEITRPALSRLTEAYARVVVIDRNIDHVEALEAEGYEVIYGDVRHTNVRKEAHLEEAAFVLSTSVERAINAAILSDVGEDTTVIVEAENREDAAALYQAGAHCVVISDRFASDQLAIYVDAYLDDPASFSEIIADDLARLREESEGASKTWRMADD